jgi:hypothetical protein
VRALRVFLSRVRAVMPAVRERYFTRAGASCARLFGYPSKVRPTGLSIYLIVAAATAVIGFLGAVVPARRAS